MIPDLHLIAIGIGVGFMLSAPVGPVNILCIKRALEQGFWGGLASGLGAVLCDALIALLAAAGITAISSAIVTYQTQLKLFGGLVMIAFGLAMWATPPNTTDPVESNGSPLWAIPQTFFLTITNPGAVLGMFAVFGSVGTAYGIGSFIPASKLVIGIVVGGLLWWTMLSLLVSTFRDRIAPRRLALISRLASIALMIFGVTLLIDVAVRSQA